MAMPQYCAGVIHLREVREKRRIRISNAGFSSRWIREPHEFFGFRSLLTQMEEHLSYLTKSSIGAFIGSCSMMTEALEQRVSSLGQADPRRTLRCTCIATTTSAARVKDPTTTCNAVVAISAMGLNFS